MKNKFAICAETGIYAIVIIVIYIENTIQRSVILICEICMKTPCANRCPNSKEITLGKCLQCNDDIGKGYEYYTDLDDNLFCSKECACEYYGIRRKDDFY